VSDHITDVTNLDGERVAVTVSYTYHRGCRGQRDSLGGVRGAGPPLDPDEPASIDIESIKDDAGNDVEVSRETERELEAEILGAIGDAQASAAEDRYEARREDERSR
jgi:hypothetical protein